MTTHHPKISIHTVLKLVGLTTEKLLPTALIIITPNLEENPYDHSFLQEYCASTITL